MTKPMRPLFTAGSLATVAEILRTITVMDMSKTAAARTKAANRLLQLNLQLECELREMAIFAGVKLTDKNSFDSGTVGL